jgi:aminoglycoside 6'-N-acetyltransferase I
LIRAICFDWGNTLMSEDGPTDVPMGAWPRVERVPGALETVARLASRYPLAIATNATVSRRPMIEGALERVDLRRYFAHVFCFTEMCVRKETDAFWFAVAERLGVAPGEIAMVGDTLEPDVLAPRRVGVRAVWFHPQASARDIDAYAPVVTQLPAFADYVDRCAHDQREAGDGARRSHQ